MAKSSEERAVEMSDVSTPQVLNTRPLFKLMVERPEDIYYN